MAPVGLKHWMLHNDQLANEFDETLELSPGYDPVRDADPALTFHAPLITGIDSIPGTVNGIFLRNSFGTYRAPLGNHYLAAGDNESRHEYTFHGDSDGLLMESASTNKCESFSDPDPDLIGWTTFGDESAVFSRVNDEKELREAGLLTPGMSAYVYKFDNSNGNANAWVRSEGQAGNTALHAVSCYCRGVGRGQVRLSTQSAGNQDLPENYERIVNILPASTNSLWEFRVTNGSVVYFKFHQLDQNEVASSFIVNHGVPTSRAIDQLSYPLAGIPYGPQILNDPGFDNASQWTVTPEVTIANGLCTFSTTAPNRHARDEDYSGIRRGNWYRVRVVVPRFIAGQLIVRLYDENQNYSESAPITESGVHERVIHLTGEDGSGSFSGTVLLTSIFSVNDFDVAQIDIREAQPILNQAEGMAALLWTPEYNEGVLPPATQRALVTFYAGNISLMFLDTAGSPYSVGVGDGATTTEVTFAAPIEAGKEYLILVTWGDGGNKQIGVKADGVTRWSSPSAYDGAFVEEGFMRIYNQPDAPEHYKHLYLWSVDRGIDWLESFFEGVAN